MPVRFDDKPRRTGPPKEELVEILVTKTMRASPDGVKIERYEEGRVYKMTRLCGTHALRNGWGVEALVEPAKEDESPKEPETVDLSTQDRTVPEVRLLVAEVKDPDVLHALRRGEEQHPRHKGGRSGVFEVLDERAAELEEAEE